MSKTLAAIAVLIVSLVSALGLQGTTHVAAATIDCSHTSTGNTALTDLGSGKYQGEQGGLYPGRTNVPPTAYQAAGVQAARSIVPLDKSGRASPIGKIVFISIGMSNTSMEFGYFAGIEIPGKFLRVA